MRRTLVIAAALGLAACQVEVEGARCRTPGDDVDCPSGQVCGNDLRCSERAAGCVAVDTFCTPGSTLAASPKRCRETPAAIETCTSADPVCGTWSVAEGQDNCPPNLVCDESSGPPACVCATPTNEIQVDPAAAATALAPTGAAQPPECQFKKLGDALDYARSVWLPAHGPASVTVRAMGTPTAGTPVTFDAESFPLVIPTGATLATSASTPRPSDWLIPAPSGTTPLVEIHDGAGLDGFTIRTTASTGDGIVVVCAAGADTPATASNVVVDGGGTLKRGVVVTGAGGCGLVAAQLEVARAARSGLYVNTQSSGVGITVSGGSLRTNGESGAEVVGGLLSIAGSSATARFDISGNARHGVRAAPDPLDPRAIALTLNLADVHDNAEVGVLVRELTAASSAAIMSSFVRKNSGTAAFSQYGTGRIAAGVLLWGTLPMTQGGTPGPAFAFKGNTVCSNIGGDAVGVYSNDPWPLSGETVPPSCGSTNNVFVNPAPSSYYVFSTTGGAALPAANNYWAPDPPTGLVMKADYVPSCGTATAPPACN